MTGKRDEYHWEKASITLEIKDLRRHRVENFGGTRESLS
jgi:hypothetical protein